MTIRGHTAEFAAADEIVAADGTIVKSRSRDASGTPNKFGLTRVVRGGYIVHHRGKQGFFRPSLRPFEHGDAETATREAERLAETHPGREFCVFQQIHSVRVAKPKSEYVVEPVADAA